MLEYELIIHIIQRSFLINIYIYKYIYIDLSKIASFFDMARPNQPVPVILDLHWENSYFISFQIEWDMILVTVLLSILNQMEFHLLQNRKENCHQDYNPFNLKGNGIRIFSVWHSPILQNLRFPWILTH